MRDLRYIANCERIDRFLRRVILRGERPHYSRASGAVCSGLRSVCREVEDEINFICAAFHRFRPFQFGTWKTSGQFAYTKLCRTKFNFKIVPVQAKKQDLFL